MDPQRTNKPWTHIDMGTKVVSSVICRWNREGDWKFKYGTWTAAAVGIQQISKWLSSSQSYFPRLSFLTLEIF